MPDPLSTATMAAFRPLAEPAPGARMLQEHQVAAVEDWDQLPGDLRRVQPGHRIGPVFLGRQPPEVLLFPPGLIRLRKQVRGREPAHRAALDAPQPGLEPGTYRLGGGDATSRCYRAETHASTCS